MNYKTYEYNEKTESSFFDSEFDSKEEAIKRANEIGINGEVWECDGGEETAVYAVREQAETTKMEETKCFVCGKKIDTAGNDIFLMSLEWRSADNHVRSNRVIELCKECHDERIPFFEGKK